MAAGLGMAGSAAGLDLPPGYLVWASNRDAPDGRHRVYRMKSDGSEIIRLTEGPSGDPQWAPDGSRILYSVEEQGSWIMNPDGRDARQVLPGYTPSRWHADGRGFYASKVAEDGRSAEVVFFDLATESLRVVARMDAFSHLRGTRAFRWQVSSDERYLLAMSDRYGRAGYTGTNGRQRNTSGGGWSAVVVDREKPGDIYFFGDGCEPLIPPQGDTWYHVFNAGGRISRMQAADWSRQSYQAITARDQEVNWAYNPRISTDGRWLTYIGCSFHGKKGSDDYDVFVQRADEPNGPRIRLAAHPANDQWPHFFVGVLPGSSPTAAVEATRPPLRPPAPPTVAAAWDARLSALVRSHATTGSPRLYVEPPTDSRVIEVVAAPGGGLAVQTTLRLAQGASTSQSPLDWSALTVRQRANLARSAAVTREREALLAAAAFLDATGEADLAARYRAQAGPEP